jgi:hypothetical protein
MFRKLGKSERMLEMTSDPDELSGFELAYLQIPAGMSISEIRAAVTIIEDWEASSRSACELIVALHPILKASFLRDQACQAR